MGDSSEEDLDKFDTMEDAIAKFQNINVPSVKRGMFVSGWEDPDDLVEEDTNPEATLERQILWAVEQGNIDLVQEILQKDPKTVHATDRDLYTPLHRAAYENHVEIAKLLLQHGADINARTEYKWTPLHSACKWNNADMVALLLQHGADVNALSDGRQTPLHVAATVSNCRDTMRTLLYDDNVQPELLNNSDETAFDIARRTGTTYPVFAMAKSALRVTPGLID